MAPSKAIVGLIALQLAGAASLAAQQSRLERLFPSRPTGYVTDVAGIVDPESAAAMESLLARLRAATGAEIAVVTLPTIEDYDAAEVALAIGRRWGVGARAEIGDPRRNAGIVVLVVPRRNGVPGTGHVRIEVGQGLEGIVTDAAAGRIQRTVMEPLLREERYGPALLAGTRALAGLVARGFGVTDSTLTAAPPVGETEEVELPWWVVPLLFLLFLSLAGALRRAARRRRGPIYWAGPWIGGGWGGGWGRGWGGFGGGGFGGGFGGFGGGGGFSGGGAGGRF